MKRYLVYATLAATLLVLALPAFAAKGGNGSATTTVSGSIDLASAALRSTAEGGMRYGDRVSFTTQVSGRLGPKARVYVRVICSQGGQVVYQWSADPSFEFPLVQQDGFTSLGISFDADRPAECVGALIYREDGGQTVIKELDQVGFATLAA